MKRAASQDLSRSGYRPQKKQRAYLAQPLNVTQKRQVSRIVQKVEEVKFHETRIVAAAIGINGALYDLCSMGQGVTSGTRSGSKILLKDVMLRFSLQIADATNQVRLIIFTYKENTTVAAPTLSTILALGPSAAVPEVLSQYNEDNKLDYAIVIDKTYQLSGVSQPQVTTNWFTSTKFLKTIRYANAALTGTNHLFLAVISDSAAVAHPSLTAVAKIRWTDS